MESAAADSPTKQVGTISPQFYFYDLLWYYWKKIAQQEQFSEICQNTACLPQKDRNTLFSYIASLSSLVGPNNVASEQPTSRGIWNGMRRLAEQAFIRRTERLMLIPKPRFGLHLHWSNVGWLTFFYSNFLWWTFRSEDFDWQRTEPQNAKVMPSRHAKE